MNTYIYHINHAKTCELAHELTLKELTEKGKAHEIDIQPSEEEGGSYTPYVQDIFDRYVNMIENIMLDEEVRKEEIEIDISEEDMEDLKHGRTFKWTFDGLKYNLPIDVKLTN